MLAEFYGYAKAVLCMVYVKTLEDTYNIWLRSLNMSYSVRGTLLLNFCFDLAAKIRFVYTGKLFSITSTMPLANELWDECCIPHI